MPMGCQQSLTAPVAAMLLGLLCGSAAAIERNPGILGLWQGSTRE